MKNFIIIVLFISLFTSCKKPDKKVALLSQCLRSSNITLQKTNNWFLSLCSGNLRKIERDTINYDVEKVKYYHFLLDSSRKIFNKIDDNIFYTYGNIDSESEINIKDVKVKIPRLLDSLKIVFNKNKFFFKGEKNEIDSLCYEIKDENSKENFLILLQIQEIYNEIVFETVSYINVQGAKACRGDCSYIEEGRIPE